MSASIHRRFAVSFATAFLFLGSGLLWGQGPKDGQRPEGGNPGLTNMLSHMLAVDKNAEPRGEITAAEARDAAQAAWDRLEPEVGEFKKAAKSYGDRTDLESLEVDRAERRARVQKLFEEFTEAHEEFKALRKSAGVITLQKILTGNRPEDMDRQVAQALELDKFHQAAKIHRTRVASFLAREDAAFNARKSEIEKRRRMIRAGAVAGAALLLIVGVLIARLRRQIALPPPSVPALSAPASASGTAATVSAEVVPPVSGPAGVLPSEPRMGSVIGENFRLDREIGRGGMGVVYEAADLALERKVAIKRMRAEISENKKELDMFLAEARLVAALKHPNLVEIFHIFNEGPELYLVFEFVSGGGLDSVLKERKRLPFQYAAGIVRQAAQGIDYAHSRKVIHRNLKPSNLMVSKEGAVKIMDFGIAYQVKKTVARLTAAESWGSPPYMAPEQEVGSVSRESDIFSLGACCYEMLTGRPAFIGPNYLVQKREMVFEPATKVAPDLPAGIDAVLSQALHAEAGRRFHSGAAFFNALLAAAR